MTQVINVSQVATGSIMAQPPVASPPPAHDVGQIFASQYNGRRRRRKAPTNAQLMRVFALAIAADQKRRRR